jgi:hypothetical protein
LPSGVQLVVLHTPKPVRDVLVSPVAVINHARAMMELSLYATVNSGSSFGGLPPPPLPAQATTAQTTSAPIKKTRLMGFSFRLLMTDSGGG